MDFSNEVRNGYNNYYIKEKIDSQTVYVEFNEECNTRGDYFFYNVSLKIYNKRNKNLYLKQTGKIGLKGLIFARNVIIEFEKFILNRWKDININCSIIVKGDDSKRSRVYKYGLYKLNFKEYSFGGKRFLMKNIK